jgi:hypothetical protein
LWQTVYGDWTLVHGSLRRAVLQRGAEETGGRVAWVRVIARDDGFSCPREKLGAKAMYLAIACGHSVRIVEAVSRKIGVAP